MLICLHLCCLQRYVVGTEGINALLDLLSDSKAPQPTKAAAAEALKDIGQSTAAIDMLLKVQSHVISPPTCCVFRLSKICCRTQRLRAGYLVCPLPLAKPAQHCCSTQGLSLKIQSLAIYGCSGY